MSCDIKIENDKLIVDHFETTNKDIISYFSDVPEAERVAKFESIILAGSVVFRSIGTTEKIDYIEKAFNNFHKCFDDKIDETFGADGKIIKEIFDPTREGTPLYRLKTEINQPLKEILEKLGGKKIADEIMGKTTLKGFSFEDYCEKVLSDVIRKQTSGDELQRTTEEYGLLAGSKKGDFVIKLGESSSKIVIEAKDVGNISLNDIHKILEESMENRDAKYGIFVVKNVESMPMSVGFFKEYYGNQLVVALGTSESEELLAKELLLVAFNWAKAKLLSEVGIEGKKDITPIVREKIQQIQDALNNFRNIRTHCTNLEKATKKILDISDDIESGIRSQLSDMEIEMNKISEND